MGLVILHTMTSATILGPLATSQAEARLQEVMHV